MSNKYRKEFDQAFERYNQAVERAKDGIAGITILGGSDYYWQAKSSLEFMQRVHEAHVELMRELGDLCAQWSGAEVDHKAYLDYLSDGFVDGYGYAFEKEMEAEND